MVTGPGVTPVKRWLDDQNFVLGGLRGIATGRGLQVHPLLVVMAVGGLNAALGRFYLLAAQLAVPFYGVLGAALVGTGVARVTVLPFVFGLSLWVVAALTAMHRRSFG